jgi:uncharacterized membrane protein
MSRTRLEAFSDGVFAIAITLLVLNLTVPRAASGHLLERLTSQWPSYVAYLVSFLVIGIVWVNHHRLCTFLESVDRPLLYLNLTLLLFNSMLPFPAALLAEYAGTADAVVATALYGIWAGFGAAVFVAMWLYLLRHPRLVQPERRHLVRAALRRSSVGPVAFAVASLVALATPWVATALYGLIMVYFAVGWVPTWPGARRGNMGAWIGRR